MKPAHHRGTYHRRSLALVAAARADPSTRCWRCGKTRDQFGTYSTGRPVDWDAGHVIAGDPDSPLLPECGRCNRAAGARLGNKRRNANRYTRVW